MTYIVATVMVSVQDVLSWVLTTAGIFALVAVGIFFIGLAKNVKKLSELVDNNKENINHSLYVLPDILENVADITYNVDTITEDAVPEVQTLLKNLNTSVENVSDATASVASITGTAEKATDSVAQGVVSIASGIKLFGDKTKDAASNVAGAVGAFGKNFKCGFAEKKRDTLGVILSYIEKIRELLGR